MTSGHYDRGVPDCLFCGIAAGQIPATIVLDGKRTIAFRDINPQAPTHVLVVPRDHFPDVAALAAAGGGLLDELVGAAREIAAAEGIEASRVPDRLQYRPGRRADRRARARARARRPSDDLAAGLTGARASGERSRR